MYLYCRTETCILLSSSPSLHRSCPWKQREVLERLSSLSKHTRICLPFIVAVRSLKTCMDFLSGLVMTGRMHRGSRTCPQASPPPSFMPKYVVVKIKKMLHLFSTSGTRGFHLWFQKLTKPSRQLSLLIASTQPSAEAAAWAPADGPTPGTLIASVNMQNAQQQEL